MLEPKRKMVLQKYVQPAVALKSAEDSLSYAIGLSVAGFYKEQGVQNVNANIVARAITDVLKTGKPLMNDQQAIRCIINFVKKLKQRKQRPNKKAGEA